MEVKKSKLTFSFIMFLLLDYIAIWYIDDMFNMLLFSIPIIGIATITIISAINNKCFLSACIIAFVLEIIVVMLIYFNILKSKEITWRASYNIEFYNQLSLKYILVSLIIILGIYMFISENFKPRIPNKLELKVKYSSSSIIILDLIFGIFILIYILKIPFMSSRSYGEVGGAITQSIFRICFMMAIIILYSLEKKHKCILLKIECCLAAFITLFLVFVSGYRYILVELVFLIFFLNLAKIKKIKIIQWGLLFLIALLLYTIFTYIKIYFLGSTWNTVLFSHEKNIFFSLNAIVKNTTGIQVETYISTLRNILPKALTGSTELNTGGILMQYIEPKIFEQSGITMGAFYLTEAYANLDVFGIIIVSILLGIGISWLDKLHVNNRSIYINLIYYFIIAETYNIIFYGSANYIKLFFYYNILAFIVQLGAKKIVK